MLTVNQINKRCSGPFGFELLDEAVLDKFELLDKFEMLDEPDDQRRWAKLVVSTDLLRERLNLPQSCNLISATPFEGETNVSFIIEDPAFAQVQEGATPPMVFPKFICDDGSIRFKEWIK